MWMTLFLFSFLFSFVACGSWEKHVELEAYDFNLQKSISLPLCFEYGFKENPYSDTAVSNQDFQDLIIEIDKITLQGRSCSYKLYGQNMLLYVPVDLETTSILRLKQTGTQCLDAPYNQYQYRYILSDLFVDIYGDGFSVSSLVFPSHLMENDFEYFEEGKTYKTSGSFDNFYAFYQDYLLCYKLDLDTLTKKEDDSLLLGGNLLYSFSKEKLDPKEKVELCFSEGSMIASVVQDE